MKVKMLTIFFALVLFFPLANAQSWYDNTWSYRKPINITNSGSALTNYQVNVILDTNSLILGRKMLPNCEDIRFTDSDGTSLLYYWIESGCNSTSTKLWVKVPNVPSALKTIYMYYGNFSASSASDGDATFDFFDDFPGTTLNTTKWPDTIGSPAVSNSELQLSISSGRESVRGDSSFSAPVIMEYGGNISASTISRTRGGFSNSLTSSSFSTNDAAYVFGYSAYAGWSYRTYDAGSGDAPASVGPAKDALYHKYKIVWTSSGVVYYVDNSLYRTATVGIPNDPSYVRFEYEFESAGTYYIEWAFVRKYASSEPIISVGEEEMAPQVPLKPGQTTFSVESIVISEVQLKGNYSTSGSYYLNVYMNVSYIGGSGDVQSICYLNCDPTGDCSSAQQCSYEGPAAGTEACTILNPSYDFYQSNSVYCQFFNPKLPGIPYIDLATGNPYFKKISGQCTLLFGCLL